MRAGLQVFECSDKFELFYILTPVNSKSRSNLLVSAPTSDATTVQIGDHLCVLYTKYPFNANNILLAVSPINGSKAKGFRARAWGYRVWGHVL